MVDVNLKARVEASARFCLIGPQPWRVGHLADNANYAVKDATFLTGTFRHVLRTVYLLAQRGGV